MEGPASGRDARRAVRLPADTSHSRKAAKRDILTRHLSRSLESSMRTHRIVASLGFVVTSSLAAQRPNLSNAARAFVAVDAPLVALTHVRLVDGTGAPAKDDQTIL